MGRTNLLLLGSLWWELRPTWIKYTYDGAIFHQNKQRYLQYLCAIFCAIPILFTEPYIWSVTVVVCAVYLIDQAPIWLFLEIPFLYTVSRQCGTPSAILIVSSRHFCSGTNGTSGVQLPVPTPHLPITKWRLIEISYRGILLFVRRWAWKTTVSSILFLLWAVNWN